MPKSYHSNLYYAYEIVLGSLIIWGVSIFIHESRFVAWGLIAFLGTLERDIRYRKLLLKQRMTHTCLATLITIICLFLFGAGYTALYTSLIVAMILGNIFTNYPTGWKILPATVAVLNYLAIVSAQHHIDIAKQLLGVRLFETILGASLAIIIQGFHLKFSQKIYRKYK